MADLGRTVAATIAQAVEPGIYLVEPDIVYEVTVKEGYVRVYRNGREIAGPDANTPDQILATVAAEMAGVLVTLDLRTTAEMIAS
jgi:hypothetical protein